VCALLMPWVLGVHRW